jgi:hypothetical protein
MNRTLCIKAYPTVTDAHYSVCLARMIYVPKWAFALRRIDGQDFVKFNNRDASASLRSSCGFNCRDHLSPKIADSLTATKIDEGEHTIAVNATGAYCNFLRHFSSLPTLLRHSHVMGDATTDFHTNTKSQHPLGECWPWMIHPPLHARAKPH